MELYDVFISYRRSDGTGIAGDLYRYLTAKGLRVFWDLEKMEYGKAFPLQLTQNIQNAPTYVLVATEDVFKFREETDGVKDYVLEEIRTALCAASDHEEERPICVLVPPNSSFPEEQALPEEVRPIAEIHRGYRGGDWNTAFEEVFLQATKVSRSNLWNAAHRAYTESKTRNGRFKNLNICQGILPNIDRDHRQTDIPIYTAIRSASGTDEQTLPLMDAITGTQNHLYLIGQGGIGKTTALMHIMGSTYENGTYTPGEMIPLFVELSFAPDTYGPLYSTNVASFIRRSIYGMLRCDLHTRRDSTRDSRIEEAFSLPDDIAVTPIDDLLRRHTGQPEFLLLLDGLNEVSAVELENGKTVMEMVAGEIDYLMRRCGNVRVILTSRFNDTDIHGSQITRLQLQGLRRNAIEDYLTLQGFSSQRIRLALSDPNLAATLRIPLFLTMYAAVSEDSSATAQGEILRLFFHERSRNLELYTNRDRLLAMEENAADASGASQEHRITARMYHFMLDFLLPELAYHMERKGLFYISDADAQKRITSVLYQTAPIDVCGSAGRAVFTEYRRSGSRRSHVQKTAMDLRMALGSGDADDWEQITDGILTCCMSTLGILQETNGRCGFVHQHIRDYFAAVKHINTLRLSLGLWEQEDPASALACMEPLFRDMPVNTTVRKFIGEYLCEHKNKPISSNGFYHAAVPEEPCDRNLIGRVLELYRGRFDGRDGYTLYSLLKILAEVRGSLAGTDLSRLDLTGCDLNGTGLGVRGLAAHVEGAKLSGRELFYSGHTGGVRHVHFNADGTRLLTFSSGNNAILWDTLSGLQVSTLTLPGIVLFLCFTPEPNRILVISRTDERDAEAPGTISSTLHADLYDNRTGGQVLSAHFPGSSYDRFILSRDGTRLLCSARSQVQFLVLSTETLLPVYEGCPDFFDEDGSFGIPGQAISFGADSGSFVFHRSVLKNGQPLCDTALFFPGSYEPLRILPELRGMGVLTAATRDNRLCVVVMAERGVELCIVDLLHGGILRRWFLANNVSQVQFSSDGRFLFVRHSGGIFVYKADSFELYRQVKANGLDTDVLSFDYSSAQQLLALGTDLCSIQFFETRDWSLRHTTQGFSPAISCACLSPDGRWLATAGDSGHVFLWDIHARTLRAQAHIPGIYDFRLSFSADSKLLSASRGYNAHLFSVPALSTVLKDTGEPRFTPDSKWLWIDSYDAGKLYPLDNLTSPVVLNHRGILAILDPYMISLSGFPLRGKHDTEEFITCEVRELRSGALAARLAIPQRNVSAVASCRELIAIASRDGHIRIFRLDGFALVAEYALDLGPNKVPFTIGFSPKGGYFLESILRSPNNFQVRVREAKSFRTVFERAKLFGALSFTPEDRLLMEVSNLDYEQNQISFYTPPAFAPQASFKQHHTGFFPSSVDQKAECAVLQTDYDTVTVCPLSVDSPWGGPWTIPAKPGLEVMGLDLRNLHPDSVLTREEKETLRTYGAITQ